jgi:hypothetical protein
MTIHSLTMAKGLAREHAARQKYYRQHGKYPDTRATVFPPPNECLKQWVWGNTPRTLGQQILRWYCG